MPAKFTKTYPVKQPKYKCKEEIEGKIEQYFKDCEGHILEDKDGNPIRDKYGYPVIVDRHPPDNYRPRPCAGIRLTAEPFELSGEERIL